ncbi:hypothetical protein [Bifidobacterium asteroides]|uniref:Uncharacterized protein n=1 Tax=Bifidobacterium asteroides TaxID=1684 RepID=A0A6N7TWF0_9BIFI|nr:hypothetical protein [Bifidobacterium asteroides]MSD90190.1 hypothetical protein [Bifidobacterium asteroides]
MTWLDERTLRIARMLREPTEGRRGYTRRLHQVDPEHDGRASKEDMPALHRTPKPLVRFPGCQKRIKDLRGDRYGVLTVLSYAGNRHGVIMWTCLCDCGRIGVHAGKDMVSGHALSCGCQRIKKGGA